MRGKRGVKLSAWQLVALEEAVRAYWTGSEVPGGKELLELVVNAVEIKVKVKEVAHGAGAI